MNVAWDAFVRFVHWSLVVGVGAAYVAPEGTAPHAWAGYVAAALVVARIGWGFIGPSPARFVSFFPTIEHVREHVRRLREREPSTGPGPFGAVMVFVLIGLVLSLGITGHLMGVDAFVGEMWLADSHRWLSKALLAWLVLHLVAALVMSVWLRCNLVAAMITGCKVHRVAGTDPSATSKRVGADAAE